MKKSIFLFALMGLVGAAHATGTNTGVTCNGNSSCSDTYNTTNNTTNQGGTGGTGYGGSATGGNSSSSATGGSSTAYGGTSSAYNGGNTSVNANTVKNESTNVQGQLQGQSQAIKNSGNSASSSNNTGNNGNSTVNVGGDTYEAKRIPVSTAYAPSIPATANCAIPVTGGFTNSFFSLSGGSAYVDKNCIALEKVRNVALVLGDVATAEALQCLDKDYAKARQMIGRPCPVEQE